MSGTRKKAAAPAAEQMPQGEGGGGQTPAAGAAASVAPGGQEITAAEGSAAAPAADAHPGAPAATLHDGGTLPADAVPPNLVGAVMTREQAPALFAIADRVRASIALPAEAPPDAVSVELLDTVDHDGRRYGPGDFLAVTPAQAAALFAGGVARGA